MSVVVHTSNIFSSETIGPVKVKFHIEPPWDGGTKVCSNDPGHITRMAHMPIYGKNLLWNRLVDFVETLYIASCTGVLPSLLK